MRSKSLGTKSTLTKSAMGSYFLRFPAELAKGFETDPKSRRVLCTLNDSHTFQCALMPNKGEYCIGVNAQIRKKLGIGEGDIIDVRLEPDATKYGAPMPDEFREVLSQDE